MSSQKHHQQHSLYAYQYITITHAISRFRNFRSEKQSSVMASISQHGKDNPDLQNGDCNSDENENLPVYALLTEASAERNIEARKMTSIPEYAVVDKAHKIRSLTPPLKTSGNASKDWEMPKQRSLSYSVKSRETDNIQRDEQISNFANEAPRPPIPFYPPQPYVPQHATDMDLADSADVVRSKPPNLSFMPYEGDAQITDEEPGYSNPYMNVSSSKRSRESRKSSLDSRTRFSGILQMRSLNFGNRKEESNSKIRQGSSRVLDFVQIKWMSIVAVIVILIFFAFIIAILAEVSNLRRQQQSTPTLSEVERIFSKYSGDISLNESYILALDALLNGFASKTSLNNASGSSNVSTCEIQPTSCPLCDYCSSRRGESNCTIAKVAELNMTSGNASECPSGFNFMDNYGVRRCESTHTAQTGGCTSIKYVTNMTYSKVYGSITAYQYGRTNSFNQFRRGNGTIDDPYVDGVSLTYGTPRQHIWTFAADRDKNTSFCPCGGHRDSIPEYVKDDYFCDTGEAEANTLASNSPLWDGRECDGSYGCCNYNSPPWFYKQLPYPTSEPIELRVCTDQTISNENIGLEYILIYVLS